MIDSKKLIAMVEKYEKLIYSRTSALRQAPPS